MQERPAGGPRHRRRRSRRGLLALAGLGLAVVLVLLVARPFLTSDDETAVPPTTDGSAPFGGPEGVTWQQTFAEDFSGDLGSLLDSGTWHTGWFGDGKLTQPINDDETSLFTDENVSVADGVAKLDVSPNSERLELRDGTTQPNLGGALNTDESQASEGFMMTYGYVEARMQLPTGEPGEEVWPAFWLTGHTWPDDMEIDVVEGDGTDQGCKFNLHYGTDDDTTNLNDVGRLRTVPGATTGMHTYAADIRPDGVAFYYDGELQYQYRGEVPDAERFIVLDASTSGKMTGTRSLLVDYVRAWTRG